MFELSYLQENISICSKKSNQDKKLCQESTTALQVHLAQLTNH